MHGTSGGSSKDTLDAHSPVQSADIARINNLYEPLLFWDDNYQIAPALAESIEPSSDAKTWTVKLRKGVTFHNGKDVTPEDVLFSIKRVADPKNPRSAGAGLSTFIDFDGTKKVDDSTVVIALKTPYAVLDWLFAEYTFGIVPTDYDPKNPVGTGAFKYKSFTPGKQSVFERYDGYWGDKAKVDQLQIQDFADANALVNALSAGQIQTMDNLPYNLMSSVKKTGKIVEAETGAWVPFTMRVDQKPFSDVRVRQAMRLICDRKQMIEQALSGEGSLGNDLYAPFDPSFASELPQREQDIDQAKSLLKAAGQSDLSVQLFTGDDIGSVATASASLFVQQAAKAGVKVSVVKKNPFYGDDYLSYTFAQDFWNTRNYIPQAAVCALKNGTYNETHFNNDKFAGLIASAQAETDEAKRKTLLQDAQEIEYNEGGYIIWGFRKQVDATSSKVSGVKPSKYLPLGNYKFNTASVSS
ncbi:ABC transporter substrate-binding protein [Nocardioides mangrovicus]|uniref:ABC transporter substrate-binding protein n=1 Tax=Nocardioides mangrovicus TaxID=2478913 RepID=A0A3L8P871_9ACTN|nr:ABC transporter substrate-binding protein [Nocardioides mangrovicus]